MSVVDYINESRQYDQAKTVAINVVSGAIPHLNAFKIGKTGENVGDRLDKPDYKEEYKFTNIKEIYHTSQKSLASKMEADLIDYFSLNTSVSKLTSLPSIQYAITVTSIAQPVAHSPKIGQHWTLLQRSCQTF